jgi:hypothetical protein
MSLSSSLNPKTIKKKKIEIIPKIKKIFYFYLIIQLSLSSTEATPLNYVEKSKIEKKEQYI